MVHGKVAFCFGCLLFFHFTEIFGFIQNVVPHRDRVNIGWWTNECDWCVQFYDSFSLLCVLHWLDAVEHLWVCGMISLWVTRFGILLFWAVRKTFANLPHSVNKIRLEREFSQCNGWNRNVCFCFNSYLTSK